MDFGQALAALKSGQWVSRSGWNGKGMYLVLRPGSGGPVSVSVETAAALGNSECSFLPYIMMKTATGEFVPWLASQTDVLSDDWGLVPRPTPVGIAA